MHITRCLWVAILFSGSLFAGKTDILVHGVFADDTPTTLWSSPGSTVDFSFVASSDPLDYDADSFSVDFSNFVYLLDGSSIAIQPVEIRAFDDALGGLFDVTFVDNGGIPRDGFSFSGPAAFSGLTSAPEWLLGVYLPNDPSVTFVAANTYGLSDLSITLSQDPAGGAPEPALGYLVGTALVGFVATLQRRKSRVTNKTPGSHR